MGKWEKVQMGKCVIVQAGGCANTYIFTFLDLPKGELFKQPKKMVALQL